MKAIRPGSGSGNRAGRIGLSFLILVLLILANPASSASDGANGTVLAVELQGAITPASDDIVLAAIGAAEAKEALALMILLNTPGGGLTETTEILRQMEDTDLPVIGFVYPEDAFAWSAGTIILISSDVAAMAPHTIIGSAQPVQLSPTGGTVPINDSKTTNAIVALIEEKARKHGRNTTAAREFVVSNLNLNADEARNYSVVEYIAASPEDLLSQINGSRAKNTTLITAGANVEYYAPPLNLQ
ncbi:MAG: nodulation protein NfeD, partial [Methanothrix sp.]|nr:nodulation protein NfeD [Methanothrix sp.]